MQHIQLPTTIEFQETDRAHMGELLITPCQKGYGTTIGNAFRRVLLSSLPGAAVESVKIDGVQHEFSAVDGVLEDMIEIILNLKQLAVKSYSDAPVVLTLRKKGLGPVTGADFDTNADVEIANPDHIIMTLTEAKRELVMEVTIATGRGYVPVAEKDTKQLALGTIAIDSLYTPIRDVGYKVENTRVGDITDFEKVILRVETNGTVSPKEAVAQATDILMDHFTLVKESAQ
jgi:DNA-directed RNA polymerase subunit alpha